MDTKREEQGGGQTIEDRPSGSTPETKTICNVKSVPISALTLNYVASNGIFIQRNDSTGLEGISRYQDDKVPDFEFEGVKLFVTMNDLSKVIANNLILDIGETREVYRVLSIDPQKYVLEHLLTKQASYGMGSIEKENFVVIIGELQSNLVEEAILKGELTSEDEDITPLLEKEAEESLRVTKEWLDDPSNQKALFKRAKEIDSRMGQKWFNLINFSTRLSLETEPAITILNLLKLGGYLIAKFNDAKNEEQFRIVFSDRQILNELETIEKNLLDRLDTIRLDIAKIKTKIN